MENMIHISTGALTLPVTRDGKAVGSITIEPGDAAFLNRFYELLPKLELQRSVLSEEFEAESDVSTRLAALDGVCLQLREDIDEVFGAGTSEIVFGKTCTLPMAEQFFTAIAAAMQASRAKALDAYTQPFDTALG